MIAGTIPARIGLGGMSNVGEWVEYVLAHLLVLGVGVEVVGVGTSVVSGGGAARVVYGEGTPVVLGVGLLASQHHLDSTKVMA